MKRKIIAMLVLFVIAAAFAAIPAMAFNYLYWQYNMRQGDWVTVDISGPANVMLMDSANYSYFCNGQTYRYYGGGYTSGGQVRLQATYSGVWYVVVYHPTSSVTANCRYSGQ